MTKKLRRKHRKVTGDELARECAAAESTYRPTLDGTGVFLDELADFVRRMADRLATQPRTIPRTDADELVDFAALAFLDWLAMPEEVRQ